MKTDKFGKWIAKVAYHVSFVAVLISDWEIAGAGNIVSVAIMGMFFFGLCHFTESSE